MLLASQALAGLDVGLSDVARLLLALIVVVAVARLAGWTAKRVGQPPVVGEVVAGILLGPSLFGRVAPGVAAFVLPDAVVPALKAVAQVGVVAFMFLVGLELDVERLRRRPGATVVVSSASIAVPFALGAALGLGLYGWAAGPSVPKLPFVLFLGVSMAVTAFPVLARILTDRGEHKSELGVLALTCAAANDVAAWCLLALVVSVHKARVADAAMTSGLAVLYLFVMLVVVRPFVERAVRRQELREGVSPGAVALVLLGVLASSFATAALGVHAIFGAFVVGAIIPHDSRLAKLLTHKLEDLVVVVLLPVFFAVTGLRTKLGLVDGWEAWAVVALVLVVASVGKIGGTYAAARLSRIPGPDALTLGILMNTRGLMELVVLHVGLDLGVVSPKLFAILVVMAVSTTLATAPLLRLARGRGQVPEGERAAS